MEINYKKSNCESYEVEEKRLLKRKQDNMCIYLSRGLKTKE